MSSFSDISEVVQVLWRRKFWLLAFATIGLAVAMISIRFITPRYRASTRVMVEPQRIPADYVKSTVTQRLEERLKTLEQEVTSPAVLEQVIREANLYPELQSYLSAEKLVQIARKDLEIETTKGAIFMVTFRGYDPSAVAIAANRVAELFIDQNLKLRESQAKGTTRFLESELEETKVKLEEQEELVSEYRLQHAGSLPEQQATNFAAIGQIEKRLDMVLTDLEEAQSRRKLLEDQVSSFIPVGEARKLQVSSLQSELEQKRLELTALRSQYTEEYPDVRRLQVEIERLEDLVGVERTGQEVEEETIPLVPDSPLVADLEEVKLEIARLESSRDRNLAEIATIQRRLERTPVVEQGLISLTRDYENLQRSYQDLLSKQLEAKLSENLEKTQQGEQFRILQRATVPSSPYFPDRLQFALVGLGLGLALGVGLVLLQEQLDQSINTLEELRSAFPAAAFHIAIPVIDVADAVDEEVKALDEKRPA